MEIFPYMRQFREQPCQIDRRPYCIEQASHPAEPDQIRGQKILSRLLMPVAFPAAAPYILPSSGGGQRR
jgi:hypothetical protein